MVLKISLIGHNKSGKTNLIRRIMEETQELVPHVERKLEVYIVEIGFVSEGTNKTVVAKIYDCGSVPPCIANREGYHNNADAAIVMYGECGPDLSLLELRSWQAVDNNRAHPIIKLDRKILEKSGKEHLMDPFTRLFRLIYSDQSIKVISLNPL